MSSQQQLLTPESNREIPQKFSVKMISNLKVYTHR